MQKRESFWAEQVKEVKLLEEKSLQCGIKLQNVLQVFGLHKLKPRIPNFQPPPQVVKNKYKQ